MVSKLVISPVKKMQSHIEKVISRYSGTVGVYISLNKSHKSVVEGFSKKKINTDKVFFIDCVGAKNVRDDVLVISPSNLDDLLDAIKNFFSEIKGEKFVVIDALSTLLIYNSENAVADFVRELTNFSSDDVEIVAVTPETKGEDLLNKIFNFFDEVQE